MTKKLLNKTLSFYLVFSVMVLLISAPAFYFATEALYRDDADESLRISKNNFIHYSLPEMQQTDIAVWNKMNRDIQIVSIKTSLLNDTLFYHNYYDSLNIENEPYRVLQTPMTIAKKPYLFSSRVSLVESEDLIQNVVLLFAAVLLFLLTGFYLLTKRFSMLVWKPFYKTLNEIEKFEIDKDSVIVFEPSDTEEFNRLNMALNKLVEKNMRIYNGQREFVENAAHELQTPLAVFSAKIDLLCQQANLTPEQAEITGKLQESVSRLNKLNKNLLLLSKIDGNQYADAEIVSVNAIVEKQISFFEEQAKAKNCTIHVTTHAEVSVKSNPVLAEVLISNLFLNAIKHNRQNGEINVVFEPGTLIFTNTGNNTALDEQKLFKRFYKQVNTNFDENPVNNKVMPSGNISSSAQVKDSPLSVKDLPLNEKDSASVNLKRDSLQLHDPVERSDTFQDENKGSGLGLAIIKKTADLNNWQITYAFENNQHIFTLGFES